MSNHAEQHDKEEGIEQAAMAQLDNLLPVGDHEEEISVDGKKEMKKGIYLLPNLFTTGALFSGFYAIVSAMHGSFQEAAIAICVAMILDIVDGRVARLTNAQSAFGAEYDSLSDMVSFGLAPALVMFQWSLHELGKLGWAIAFVYVACAAVRLARFNTQKVADKRFFTGLASPAAATLLACTVWLNHDLGWLGEELPWLMTGIAAVLTLMSGLLMVSNVRYQSFKGVDLRARVPLIVLILFIVVFAIILINPPSVLLLMLIIYALSGPLFHSKAKKQIEQAAAAE